MAWLPVPEDDATAELAQLTEPWLRRAERVPPVMGVLKRNPRAFTAVLGLNYAVAFGASSLGRRLEELIATWVSALNDCFFCLATHARYLEKVWAGREAHYLALIAGMAALAPRVRARDADASRELAALPGLERGEAELLAFVSDLTLEPEKRERSDHDRLRGAGYSEAQILDAVLVCACFAFMNRLACGTGVTLETNRYPAAVRLFGQAALDRHIAWASQSPNDE